MIHVRRRVNPADVPLLGDLASDRGEPCDATR